MIGFTASAAGRRRPAASRRRGAGGGGQSAKQVLQKNLGANRKNQLVCLFVKIRVAAANVINDFTHDNKLITVRKGVFLQNFGPRASGNGHVQGVFRKYPDTRDPSENYHRAVGLFGP